MGDMIYYEERLQGLIQLLKVFESNDTLEDLLLSLDTENEYYTDLEDMQDNFNEITFDNYVNGKIHDLEREILSILKMIY